jgi:glycosyltransferase involved in cell wall biosynthesis
VASEQRPDSAESGEGASAGPEISVIIPVYNGERFLAESIESSLAQHPAPKQVIVIDDASTDGSVEVARRYPEVTLIELETNGGPGRARNRGIAAASGEFIANLDHDDIHIPGRFATQLDYLAEHPEHDLVIGRVQQFHTDDDRPDWAIDADSGQLRGSAAASADDIPMIGTLMCRRSAFELHGDFDETMHFGEDVEWLVRMMDLGAGVGIVAQPLIYRRLHSTNMVSDQGQALRGVLHAMKRRIERRRVERADGAEPQA